MLELLNHFFAAVCGQNPGHTWAPGGILLPCCQRCTGLYAGAGIAAMLHLWLRPNMSNRFLYFHGAFLLLMAPFGFHWLPQGPVLRTITGVLFGFGVIAYLGLPLRDWVVAQVFNLLYRRFSNRRNFRMKCALGNPERLGTSHALPTGMSAIRQAGKPALLRLRLCCTKCSHGYGLFLVVTLALLPVLAKCGGKSAAYGLSSLAFCGAVCLGLLILTHAGLGLNGVIGWVCQPRRLRIQS